VKRVRVMAQCAQHPDSVVYLRDGAMTLIGEDNTWTHEGSQMAVMVEFDAGFLECSENYADHELSFHVSELRQ